MATYGKGEEELTEDRHEHRGFKEEEAKATTTISDVTRILVRGRP